MSTSGPERQRRRDREAVVDVPQPGAGDRRVDGQDQGREPGGLGAPDEVEPGVAVAPQVELEPAVRLGRRAAATASGDVVPRVDSAYGMPRRPATRVTAGSPSVVHQPREAGRGEDQRHATTGGRGSSWRGRPTRRRAARSGRTRSGRTPRASVADSSRSRRRRRCSRRRRAGRAGGRRRAGPRWSRPRPGGARPATGGSDRSAGTAGARTGGGVGVASSDVHGGSIPDGRHARRHHWAWRLPGRGS